MIAVDERDGWLLCPLCGEGGGTHIDFVHVSAREEGRDFVEIELDAIRGSVLPSPEPGPVGPAVGVGRRHRIALRGWCEICGGRWSLVFTQHKGVTYAEAVPDLSAGALGREGGSSEFGP